MNRKDIKSNIYSVKVEIITLQKICIFLYRGTCVVYERRFLGYEL